MLWANHNRCTVSSGKNDFFVFNQSKTTPRNKGMCLCHTWAVLVLLHDMNERNRPPTTGCVVISDCLSTHHVESHDPIFLIIKSPVLDRFCHISMKIYEEESVWPVPLVGLRRWKGSYELIQNTMPTNRWPCLCLNTQLKACPFGVQHTTMTAMIGEIFLYFKNFNY